MRFQGSKFSKKKNSSSASPKNLAWIVPIHVPYKFRISQVPLFRCPFLHPWLGTPKRIRGIEFSERFLKRCPNPKPPSLREGEPKHHIESYPDYPLGLPGAGLAGGSGAITRGRPGKSAGGTVNPKTPFKKTWKRKRKTYINHNRT